MRSSEEPPHFRATLTLRGVAWLVAAGLAAPACAARQADPLAHQPTIVARDRQIRALQRDVASLLASPTLTRGIVGVAVESLDRGDRLFRYNADRLLMPGSNMKLLTLAAAAERLGWEHTFTTAIAATAPIVGGVLHGDLVVRGTGDPTINSRDGAAARVLGGWAEALWALGLRRIEGRIIGDDDAFDDESFGTGWAWDNLPYGYAAPVGALQVNEDAIEIVITPAAATGAPAHVEQTANESGLRVDAVIVTGAAGGSTDLRARRRPGTCVVRVTGSVPAGGAVARRTFSVDNPTEYFLQELAAALARRGIAHEAGLVDVDDLPAGAPPAPVTLVAHRSPPLRDAARVLMQASQNLYAETLLRALSDERAPASIESGRSRALETLASLGVPGDSVVLSDGSGLSRYNYVTADALVTVLRRMYADPRHRDAWMAALPAAGVDGTLQKRFRGTRAEGRVRAKTGTISNVRAISGYVPTDGGEMLAFAILVNNVTAAAKDIDAVTDAVIGRLTGFRR